MAILEIADNSESNPTSLQTISKNQKISLSYLEQIFSSLKKSGIVKSIKGPGGGYVLGRESNNINISQIIRATGEPVKMTRCGGKKDCNKSGIECKTHHIWYGLEKQIYEYLDSISLSDVCK